MRTKYAAILNLVEDEKNLKPLTDRRPVASLPFATRYRLIDFPFSSLSNAKIKSAALFISGTGRSLYDHIRSGINWGLDNFVGGGVFTHSQIDLKASLEDREEYMADYYYDHRNYLKRSKAKYVILTGSRVLANLQIDSMANFHEDKNSDITVAYKKIARNEVKEETIFSGYRIAENPEKNIEEVFPLKGYSGDDEPVAFGLDFMIANMDVMMHYLDKLEEKSVFVSVENILRMAIEEGNKNVVGYEYTGYMKAIEDIKSYFDAHMDMLDEKKFNALFYRESPVLTKSKNSAPTYYGEHSVVKNSLIANDSEIYGVVEDSLISRKNLITQDTTVNNSIILQNCFIDEGAELEYVILDKRVHVEKGAKLTGTPDNPLVVGKGCRVLSNGDIVEG